MINPSIYLLKKFGTLTTRELGELCALHYSQISRIKNGYRDMSIDSFFSILSLLPEDEQLDVVRYTTTYFGRNASMMTIPTRQALANTNNATKSL